MNQFGNTLAHRSFGGAEQLGKESGIIVKKAAKIRLARLYGMKRQSFAHERHICTPGKLQMFRRFRESEHFGERALESAHTRAAAADQSAVNIKEYKSNHAREW